MLILEVSFSKTLYLVDLSPRGVIRILSSLLMQSFWIQIYQMEIETKTENATDFCYSPKIN